MRGDYIVARRLIHLAQQQGRAADRADVARRVTRVWSDGRSLDELAAQLDRELLDRKAAAVACVEPPAQAALEDGATQ
jgi:hypothetical protein